MTSIYGQIVSAEDIRTEAIAHIKRWAPSYFAEVARQRSIPALTPFKGYGTVAGNGADLPMCVVAVADTQDGSVERRGDGTVGASWTLAVASVVSAPTRDDATALASLYGAAIRGIFVQHPKCGTHIRGGAWIAEKFEEVAWDDSRAIVASVLYFTVDVPAMADSHGGLTAPPADPSVPIDGFTVHTINVGVAQQ